MNHFILIQFNDDGPQQVFASDTKQGAFLRAKDALVKQYTLELDGADLFCQLIIMEKAVYDASSDGDSECGWAYYEL